MAKKIEIPQDKLDAYNALIAQFGKVERKGKTNPYTSLNGHMFTHLSKVGIMGLRLSKEDQAAFMKKYNADLYIQYGATMRGYVSVPDDMLVNPEKLLPYLQRSYDYIKTLEPK